MIEKTKQRSASSSPEGWGTGKEYAAHRKALGLSGATPAAVSQAKSAGRISPPDARGLYHFATADREWAANTKSQHRGPDAPPAEVARTPPPHGADWPAAMAPPTAGQAPDRKDWDAWKVFWQAERERMEAQKMAGDLYEREKVKLAVGSLFRGIRDKLLSIPPRIRVALAAAEDPAQVDQILTGELHRALQEPDLDNVLATA